MVVSLLIILIRVPFLPARRPHWQASRHWLARSLRSAASCWAWACERAASRPGGLRCASGGYGLSSCCPTGFVSFSASMCCFPSFIARPRKPLGKGHVLVLPAVNDILTGHTSVGANIFLTDRPLTTRAQNSSTISGVRILGRPIFGAGDNGLVVRRFTRRLGFVAREP